MLIISYDIHDDKLRNLFSKMLRQSGAIRLQYSVYEVKNTNRVQNNLILKIEELFANQFGGEDSVIIFEVPTVKLRKFGNAIHRDADIVYL